MGANTFYSLYKEHEFPAQRLPDGRWMTTKTLIDEWIKARWRAEQAARKAAEKELTTSGN
jgi:predicted DNA-binding transcriptional regulator AlpA